MDLLSGESRVDGSKLDVGENDTCTAGRGLNGCWDTRSGRAGTACRALHGRADRVGGVEPEHVGVVVIPQRHDEDHTSGERLAHGSQAAFALEVGLIAESGLLRIAVCGGDGIIASDTGHGGLGVGNHHAILDVEALDLAQHAARLDELGDDGEDGIRVDCQAWTVEAGVTLAVAVEVTSIRVTLSVVAVSFTTVCSSTGITVADYRVNGRAWVCCESG